MSRTPRLSLSTPFLADDLQSIPGLQRQHMLPSAGWILRLGGLGLLGVVVVSLGLAASTPYQATVEVPVRVRPWGEVRPVQAAVAGVITQVYVHNDQEVKAGQVIAQVNTLDLDSDRQQLYNRLQATEQQLQTLSLEALGLVQQYQAQQALQTQRVTWGQAQLAQAQQQQMNHQRIAASDVQEASALLDLAQDEQRRYAALAEVGAIAQLQLQEKNQALKAAQARMLKAQVEAQPLVQPLAAAQAEIGQAQAEGETELAKLRQAQTALERDRIRLQGQLARDRQALIALQSKRIYHQIKAPVAGTLLRLTLYNRGQVVGSGNTVAHIVPSQGPMVVEAQVSPEAIGTIQTNLQAQPQTCRHPVPHDRCQGMVQLRIDAYPYPDYGTLKGWIQAIAADTTSETTAPTMTAPTPYYTLQIQLEHPYLQKNGTRYPLRPGMTGTAEILGPPETVLHGMLRKARLLTH